MRALIVVESVFGNTSQVAAAVASGVAPTVEVEVQEANHAPPGLAAAVDLLIVGGPTHAFSMSRPGTRADARSSGPLRDQTPATGIREWLASLDGPRPQTLAATFDTKIHRPRLPGSAARAAHRRLRKLGFVLLDAPTSFWVEKTEGPLVPGEEERARAWGRSLADAATARGGSGSVTN